MEAVPMRFQRLQLNLYLLPVRGNSRMQSLFTLDALVVSDEEATRRILDIATPGVNTGSPSPPHIGLRFKYPRDSTRGRYYMKRE